MIRKKQYGKKSGEVPQRTKNNNFNHSIIFCFFNNRINKRNDKKRDKEYSKTCHKPRVIRIKLGNKNRVKLPETYHLSFHILRPIESPHAKSQEVVKTGSVYSKCIRPHRWRTEKNKSS